MLENVLEMSAKITLEKATSNHPRVSRPADTLQDLPRPNEIPAQTELQLLDCSGGG